MKNLTLLTKSKCVLLLLFFIGSNSLMAHIDYGTDPINDLGVGIDSVLHQT